MISVWSRRMPDTTKYTKTYTLILDPLNIANLQRGLYGGTRRRKPPPGYREKVNRIITRTKTETLTPIVIGAFANNSDEDEEDEEDEEEDHRNDPCFKGDTLILMEDDTYKQISDLKKQDRLRLSNNKIGIIDIVLKTECGYNKDLCFVDEFYVTPYHEISKMNRFSKEGDTIGWKYPINITQPVKLFTDYVYNLHIVMEDGSLPNAGYMIKGLNDNWAGITMATSKNPFWNTHILEIFKYLESEIDETGVLLFKKGEFNLLKNNERTTYAMRYKNKIYTCENDKVVVLDYIDKKNAEIKKKDDFPLTESTSLVAVN